MIPGTAAWNDASNNKAFLARRNPLDQQRHLDLRRGAEQRQSRSPRTWTTPTSRSASIGKPTELHLMYPVLAMTYTKYPQACKALMAFMLEADNFNPWIQSAQGLSDALPQRLRQEPGVDRRSEGARRSATSPSARCTAGGLGSVGEKAATAIADFVVVDMFANYCTGREDVKGSIAIAERQLKRIYR